MGPQSIACFAASDYAAAVKYAYQATAKRPDRFYNYYLLAATQAASGDAEAARKSIAEGQRNHLYRLHELRIGLPFADEGVFTFFVENLRKTGWAA